MAAPPPTAEAGENWKQQLNLPPKDTRIQTEVSKGRGGRERRRANPFFHAASGHPHPTHPCATACGAAA